MQDPENLAHHDQSDSPGGGCLIRAVVFDLDGVIRHWDVAETHSIERRHRIEPDSIHSIAFDPRRSDAVICGEISDEQWREDIAVELGARYGQRGRTAADEWSRRRGTLDRDIVELVRVVRTTCSVVLLTNATSRLDEDLEVLGLDRQFDVIFNSSSIGTAKPSVKIYEHVSRCLDLAPSEWLFVDDSPSNVNGARTHGVSARHFVDRDDLVTWLESEGISFKPVPRVG